MIHKFKFFLISSLGMSSLGLIGTRFHRIFSMTQFDIRFLYAVFYLSLGVFLLNVFLQFVGKELAVEVLRHSEIENMYYQSKTINHAIDSLIIDYVILAILSITQAFLASIVSLFIGIAFNPYIITYTILIIAYRKF